MITSRRSFIAGVATLFAAPAIVRASSLMAVRSLPRPLFLWGDVVTTIAQFGPGPPDAAASGIVDAGGAWTPVSIGENGSLWQIQWGPEIKGRVA